jgi:hypothetical protein
MNLKDKLAAAMNRANQSPMDDGGKKKKRKDTSSMYNLQNVYTGPDNTDPGVLQAQKDKKKRDAVIKKYKKG